MDSRLGINFGIFADKQLSPYSSLYAGGNYSLKGFKRSEEEIDVTETFHYVTFPVQYRIFKDQPQLGRIYAGAGISANIFISGKYEVENSSGESYDGDVEDLTVFEISAVFSAGMYFHNKFKAEIMYDHGLTDIRDIDITGLPKIKTRTFMIMFGYIPSKFF